METQITSNFIPLQQPYPVIKHLYKIGVQIGIQIVTVAGGTPFKIETHRYPVVAAEDDKNLSSIKDLTQLGGAAATPVVWDNVDVDNVLVLFKLNAELNWTDLIKLLWEDQAKYADPRQLLQTYMLMKLSSYCRSITLNAPGSCPIHLSLVTDADGQPLAVSSKHDDILALYAHWSDDAATMEGSILNNLQDYLLFVQQKNAHSLAIPAALREHRRASEPAGGATECQPANHQHARHTGDQHHHNGRQAL